MNRQHHKPNQPWMKVASLSGGWYLSYAILWPQSQLVALSVGSVACVCVDLLLAYASEAERHLTAEFLAAEDLLIARATCHKVNNALKGESARFWLHARLRRRFRGQANLFHRTRGYSTGLWFFNQACQFIHEASVLVLAKMLGTRYA
ncbi:hypothetical protein JG687_00011842 [Phytophthora cactorum]|uniref:Uncharacterized protein n=1 Tax=Phytophthora cactorum TaxID=29920 RepID=A0A8T1U397_9STRA|nr:hypothetical protein JG687_00011842 [Phytophthora cactorum]